MAKDILKQDDNYEEEKFDNGETDDEEYDLGFDTYYGQRERKTREELRETFDLPSLDDVKEGQYLDFHYRGLGNGAAREIAKKLKFKKGVYLDLSDCEIGGEGVDEFSHVKLEEDVTLDFSNNHIEGLFAARFLFERIVPDGVTINLRDNEIDGFSLEEYYEAYKNLIEDFPIHLGKGAKLDLSGNYIGDKGAKILKDNMELEEGATLDLSGNYIGDKGAKILKDNMELEEGATLNLSNNNISDDMKKELKEWEKSYHDEGINCKIIV